MKRIFACLFLSGIISTCAVGAIGTGAQERQSLRIHQTVNPVFPHMVSSRGITRGTASLLIDVGIDGALEDALIVGYSRREFADAAIEAVKKWTFDPMLLSGQPVPCQTQLAFNFEATGVVVSMDFPSSVEARLNSIFEGRGYRPATLRELDQIPLPVSTIAPMYPKELLDRGVLGEVVVEFYIDENGSVRMPAVINSQFVELGYLAIAAVRQWKFEPPTRHGEPVLTRVQQQFNFGQHQG